MFTQSQSLFERQTMLDTFISTATVDSLFRLQTVTLSSIETTVGDDGPHGPNHCYVVAEVANFVTGILVDPYVSITIPVGTTSFTFGGDLIITPAPRPITLYDFSDTYIISGKTMYHSPLDL